MPQTNDKQAEEEAFLSLLQRIQKQYHASSSSSSSKSSPPVNNVSRPPDEAAYALGRGLAQSFLKLATTENVNKHNDEADVDNDAPRLTTQVIPKNIQEKSLIALGDRRLNPSVCRGFFDTLLQTCKDSLHEYESSSSSSNSTTTLTIINMDAWLPAWLLYTEQMAVSERDDMDGNDDYDDDWLSLCLDPLTCMVEAYAEFVGLKIRFEQAQQQQSSQTTTNAMDPRSLSHPSSYIGIVAKTYSKLQTQAGRVLILREFTKIAFETPSTQQQQQASSSHPPMYKLMLTPLMACSVLSASSTTSNANTSASGVTEATLFMEGIWRAAYSVVYDSTTTEQGTGVRSNENEDIPSDPAIGCSVEIILWLATCLNMFLLSTPSRPSSAKVACKELAHRWLAIVLDLGVFVSQGLVDMGSEQTASGMKCMRNLFEEIISNTLLRLFALIPSYRMSMYDFWEPLKTMTTIFTADQPLSLVATFKLATIALSHPIAEDVAEILNLLAISIEGTSVDNAPDKLKSQKSIHQTAFAILRGLGSIFLRNKACALATANLLETLSRTRRLKSNTTGNIPAATENAEADSCSGESNELSNLIQLLEQDPSVAENLTQLASTDHIGSDANPSLSPVQQSALLAFGLGLLDSSQPREPAFLFLTKVLAQYPHLGVSLLPVMVDSINAAAIRGESECMTDHINFLCETVVRDNQCAREVWNLLGVELIQESIPAIVRSSIMRFFPKICLSNKRLYKRVIESMGHTLLATTSGSSIANGAEEDTKGDLEMRLAIAANTADLARDDLIRDPTDVIGWIQGFISDAGWVQSVSTRDRQNAPGRAALVHYAIMSLHHLVVAQELDYKLVLVVLGKRLCGVHDLDQVTKLPPLVLEALISLLGDGEEDEGDSDEDRPKTIGAAPHAVKSVETLINLWHCESLRIVLRADPIVRWTVLNCRKEIFNSLAKYSFEALGIDEEAVSAIANAAKSDNEEKSHSPSADRYTSFKYIIEDGMMILKMNRFHRSDESQTRDVFEAFAAFVSKILKFEEDCMGSTLWQKRGNQHKPGPKKAYGKGLQVQLKPEASKSLPSPAMIMKTHNDNPCQATALAALLVFEGKPLSLLEDLAKQAASDPFDPLTQTFYLQSWINATRNMLGELVSSMSSSELLDKLLVNIQEWRLDNPDACFMALSCIALQIPQVLGPYGDHSSYVKDIVDDVFEAYNSHTFDDQDTARICLGFVAVSDLSTGSTQRVEEVIKTLQRTVTGYGGQPSFGAFYALGAIAQACSIFGTAPDLSAITQIIGFLVEQLIGCIKGTHEALGSLVKCIKKGEITPEVIEGLTAMKKKSLKIAPSKMKSAQSIFISFAVCLPAVTKVNDELLLGIYCLLESLAWGCGKGFCLPAVLHSCRETGLFEADEIEKMYTKYAKLFEESMEKGTEGLDDIFYAVTAIQSKPIPYSIRKFMVGNRNLFDESGRALSLVSAVVSISSIPCLGRGARVFWERPCLAKNVENDDIVGVVESVSEGSNSSEWNLYSQMGTTLMGFMASLETSIDIDPGNNQNTSMENVADSSLETLQLPSAHQGTVLEIVMQALQGTVKSFREEPPNEINILMLKMLGCLEVLSLPGHFAFLLEAIMSQGDDEVKTICAKVIVSQVHGRPRAVFDGHEFVNLSLKMSKLPITALRGLLGEGNAASTFLKFYGDMLAKFPSQSVEEAAEGVFRYCINCVGHSSQLTVQFLQSIKGLLHRASDSKSFRFSPKALSSLQALLLHRIFAGLRDAAWPTHANQRLVDQQAVVEAYADCLMEIPSVVLDGADFFSTKELDGFNGESLRIQVVMILVRNEYFKSSSRAFGETASAIAWTSRQLVACNDEVFSCAILCVACAIAKASEKEPSNKKKELLVSLLDNLLMVSSNASFVGLEVLAVIAFQWCNRNGSDGDLSLLFGIADSSEKWQDLSPSALKETFRLAVHDLPFNLARYARQAKLSGVIFNRLWRLYVKWWEQGSSKQTLEPLKRCLLCCQDADISSTEILVTLTTSMALEK
ncbi:MAG: hypothetical protein SGILL_004085 [Bacillariaceae sp.]